MPPVAFQPPYLFAFLAAVVVFAVPEIVGAVRQHAPADAIRRDGRSKAVLMGCLAAAGFTATVAALSVPGTVIASATTVVFGVGVALVVAGVALRWYAVSVLGKYFTREVAVQPDQHVVDEGPYAVVRHPGYTGGALSMLGFGIALTNWLSLALVVVLVGAGYVYRIRVEERALAEELGDDYRQYRQETPYRLIPFVW